MPLDELIANLKSLIEELEECQEGQTVEYLELFQTPNDFLLVKIWLEEIRPAVTFNLGQFKK